MAPRAASAEDSQERLSMFPPDPCESRTRKAAGTDRSAHIGWRAYKDGVFADRSPRVGVPTGYQTEAAIAAARCGAVTSKRSYPTIVSAEAGPGKLKATRADNRI